MEDFQRSIEDKLSETAPDVLKIECIEKLSRGIDDNSFSVLVEKILVRVLMRDRNAVVRHEAAFALGRLYASHSISGFVAVEALCKSAREDTSLLVRHEAAESLGCISHPVANTVLSELLYDEDDDISATAEIALQRQAKLFVLGPIDSDKPSRTPTE